MSKFQTKNLFSIVLFVMLFLVLTNADCSGFDTRLLIRGQPCSKSIIDDGNCYTEICRIKGEDTGKCQLTDEQDVGDDCLVDAACKTRSYDPDNFICLDQ
ncbi:hypothetical protein C2G38_2156823 [Gigaspora rosea]|uniref:Uncharacterized protein n=1 Tax=Gigaspora rosea TaxID=44941 RepID=A0A397W5K3_9GLOM|nr:hypothetical protein C2G38_2156823 [Gigaspora rosea]